MEKEPTLPPIWLDDETEQPEQQLSHETIASLLPRYYEVHGENPSYTTLQLMEVDSHEVAWMEYNGVVVYDITGNGREGTPYTGHTLECACHFTEGVGWMLLEDGRPAGISGGDSCEAKAKAVDMRHHELHEKYVAKGMLSAGDEITIGEVEGVMLDLIEKAKNGEFLEGSNGAEFWGGYYYLQTAAAVAGISMHEIWAVTDHLIVEKKIMLEGCVVQDYREPPPPAWTPFTSYESQGWKATALLPAHSRMPQEWKFEVTQPDGEKLDLDFPAVALTHSPDFGPDVDDVDAAQKRLMLLVENARQDAAIEKSQNL